MCWNNAVAWRQLELLGRRVRQVFVLIQIKHLDLLACPIGFLQKLDAGHDRRIGFEAINVQISEQNLEPILTHQLLQHLFETNAVKRVVLVVDVGRISHGSLGQIKI